MKARKIRKERRRMRRKQNERRMRSQGKRMGEKGGENKQMEEEEDRNRVPELCESRGSRPGPSPNSPVVSVDVKQR